jgi:hypothetical protein
MEAAKKQAATPKKRKRRAPRAWFMYDGVKLPLSKVDMSLLPDDDDELSAVMHWAEEHPEAQNIPMDMWLETKSPEEMEAIQAEIREMDLEREKHKGELSPLGKWLRNPEPVGEILDMRAVLK